MHDFLQDFPEEFIPHAPPSIPEASASKLVIENEYEPYIKREVQKEVVKAEAAFAADGREKFGSKSAPNIKGESSSDDDYTVNRSEFYHY